jgi:hypothetical protein
MALVRTDVSEELSATFIRVNGIGEIGTTLAVTSSLILVTLMKEALSSSETSVLTRTTGRNIPFFDDTVVQLHCYLQLSKHQTAPILKNILFWNVRPVI